MILRLVIRLLRRVLWGMVTIVVWTLLGGGRRARSVLRMLKLTRRLTRF
jgi:hypothetical protein